MTPASATASCVSSASSISSGPMRYPVLMMSSAAVSDLELESSSRLYCHDETRERIEAFLEGQ